MLGVKTCKAFGNKFISERPKFAHQILKECKRRKNSYFCTKISDPKGGHIVFMREKYKRPMISGSGNCEVLGRTLRGERRGIGAKTWEKFVHAG